MGENATATATSAMKPRFRALVATAAIVLAWSAVFAVNASGFHRLPNQGHWDKFGTSLAYMKVNDYTGSAWPVFSALISWDQGANRITTTYVGGSSNCGLHCVNTATIAPGSDPYGLMGSNCTGALAWTETQKIDTRNHFREDVRIRINGSCSSVLNQNQRLKVACHEEGHALGLDHFTQNDNSCMHTGNITQGGNSPNSHDFEVINQSIYTHPDN